MNHLIVLAALAVIACVIHLAISVLGSFAKAIEAEELDMEF